MEFEWWRVLIWALRINVTKRFANYWSRQRGAWAAEKAAKFVVAKLIIEGPSAL